MFAQVFQDASEQHPDITFGKIDTEDQPELSAAARITSLGFEMPAAVGTSLLVIAITAPPRSPPG